jgi:hypothetical protein
MRHIDRNGAVIADVDQERARLDASLVDLGLTKIELLVTAVI